MYDLETYRELDGELLKKTKRISSSQTRKLNISYARDNRVRTYTCAKDLWKKLINLHEKNHRNKSGQARTATFKMLDGESCHKCTLNKRSS